MARVSRRRPVDRIRFAAFAQIVTASVVLGVVALNDQPAPVSGDPAAPAAEAMEAGFLDGLIDVVKEILGIEDEEEVIPDDQPKELEEGW